MCIATIRDEELLSIDEQIALLEAKSPVDYGQALAEQITRTQQILNRDFMREAVTTHEYVKHCLTLQQLKAKLH